MKKHTNNRYLNVAVTLLALTAGFKMTTLMEQHNQTPAACWLIGILSAITIVLLVYKPREFFHTIKVIGLHFWKEAEEMFEDIRPSSWNFQKTGNDISLWFQKKCEQITSLARVVKMWTLLAVRAVTIAPFWIVLISPVLYWVIIPHYGWIASGEMSVSLNDPTRNAIEWAFLLGVHMILVLANFCFVGVCMAIPFFLAIKDLDDPYKVPFKETFKSLNKYQPWVILPVIWPSVKKFGARLFWLGAICLCIILKRTSASGHLTVVGYVTGFYLIGFFLMRQLDASPLIGFWIACVGAGVSQIQQIWCSRNHHKLIYVEVLSGNRLRNLNK